MAFGLENPVLRPDFPLTLVQKPVNHRHEGGGVVLFEGSVS